LPKRPLRESDTTRASAWDSKLQRKPSKDITLTKSALSPEMLTSEERSLSIGLKI
jgi:hypothetical protein